MNKGNQNLRKNQDLTKAQVKADMIVSSVATENSYLPLSSAALHSTRGRVADKNVEHLTSSRKGERMQGSKPLK